MELPKEKNTSFVINSRFGSLSVSEETKIIFPLGLLGLEEDKYFFVAKSNDPKLNGFVILQSANKIHLSFLSISIPLENNLISLIDIEKAAKQHSLSATDISILLICRTKIIDIKPAVFANVKAPLIIDVPSKKAVQHVLYDAKYKIQHRIL